MVGTHIPDDRDLFDSGLQRMREAFEALREGRLSPGAARDEFLIGYDTVSEISSMFFLRSRTAPPPDLND
jgi:hypothetical protein